MPTGKTKPSIAKNAAFLYLRMLLTMFVSLYTSRVVLNALGFEDYGIYNVVGGFVVMFNVVCTGLASTTQRFITYEIGQGDRYKLNRTFSSCVIIYASLSLVIIILAETLGLWFFENKMVVPVERHSAAQWAYQFALLTLVVNLVSIPYNALIIAYERMQAFAYISIYEVSAKLIIAYLVSICPYDKLITYAILMCAIQISIRVIYGTYCKKNFSASKVVLHYDWNQIKEIYGFAKWAMVGGMASIGFTQGLNILLNMFFGPTINAARGIAVQVQSTVNSFALNFQTAVNPRIIKSYAERNLTYMYKLVFISSKFSFLLLFVICLPLLIETEFILKIWLKNVPEYTVIFLRLIMVTTIVDAMANPFMRVAEATGNIRRYQVVLGIILLMIVPISYFALKLGCIPSSVFIVHIVISLVAFCVRLYIVKSLVDFSIKTFFKTVIFRVFSIGVLSPIVPLVVYSNMNEGFLRFVVVIVLSILIMIALTWYLALEHEERQIAMEKIKLICSK